jgi:hypothetical protein
MRTTLTCLLAAAALALAGCGGTDRTEDSARASAATPAATTTAEQALDRDLKKVTYEGADGETALDLLRDAGYDVTVKSSKLGDYVTGIGDVEATNSEYWLFEVDGKMPSVGADVYETKDGEKIEWRYGS